MNSANIASRLTAIAAAMPDHPAVVMASVDGAPQQYTLSELDQRSTVLGRGLQQIGLLRGMRAVLMVPPGLDFFALVFALFKAGVVLVGIDPGMGVKHIGKCLAEAGPDAFIGNGRAHLARRLAGWAGNTLKIRISTEALLVHGRTIHLQQVFRRGMEAAAQPTIAGDAHDQAAILFTSGSTGVPKGAAYTHGNFSAQVSALQKTFAIARGEIDLATFPLFALFGPVLGMTSLIPRMDFTRPGTVDAARIVQTIKHYGATTMFGSPALLERVARWGAANHQRLPTLKRVLCAGAPVAPATLERFGAMLDPGTRIHTPYGATEALPVTTIASDEVLRETRSLTDQGRGVCVGRPVTGMTVKIIRITDAPIAAWSEELVLGPGEIGEITVQGPQVSASYFHREEATRLAKIAGGDNTFFHRMGDLGYFDDRGRLWFCGRKSQRIESVNGTWFTIPCEAVFNVHPKVRRTALVGVSNHGYRVPVICVELEAGYGKADYHSVRRELAELGGRFQHTESIRDFLFHPGFPVDIRHNAKIGREQLGKWAEKFIA